MCKALFVILYVFEVVMVLIEISTCFCYCLTGDVELTNMQLKPEALNALKLPVKVKAGFLGSVKIKVCEISISTVHNISSYWDFPSKLNSLIRLIIFFNSLIGKIMDQNLHISRRRKLKLNSKHESLKFERHQCI